jgi:energy-coupling factor transporter transmembrane protein EcfT
MEQTIQTSIPPKQRKMRRTLLGTVPVVSPLYDLHPVTRLFTLLFLGVVSLFILTPEINILLIVLIFLYLKWARVDISGLRIYLPLTITVAIFMFTVSTIFPVQLNMCAAQDHFLSGSFLLHVRQLLASDSYAVRNHSVLFHKPGTRYAVRSAP